MRSTFSRETTGRKLALGGAIAAAAMVAGCGGSDGPPALVQSAETCTALTGRSFDAAVIGEPTGGAVVTAATYQAAVADAPNAQGTALVPGTPDYCQVLLDIRPVDPAAPLIKSQVNLPTTWNGKKLQIGGGGFNGNLVTGLQPARNASADVPLPLTRGYLTAGTDSGHQNQAGVEPQAFALNEEALRNYAYASYKKTHDVAVQLAQAYYGRAPSRSYYMGGSEGGREGLMMAQRYPADFDGIVTIDPVIAFTGLQTFGNWVGGILQSAPGGWLDGKTQLVHDTVVGACDALDGIADGVVSHYKGCQTAAPPAIAALRCPSGADEGASCLSDGQIATVNAAHAGYTFNFALANGVTKYPGFGWGGEGLPGNWSNWMVGTTAPAWNGPPTAAGTNNLYAYGNGFLRYFIARDAAFNPLGFDPTAFQARMQEVSGWMDATNPDLSAFLARGGRIILKEDMSDTAQSPYTGLTYYESVVARMGQATADQFFAAYATPGLPHTSFGIAPGTANAPSYGIPGQVDLLALLESWVEGGSAPPSAVMLQTKTALPPHTLVASKPMCRYPMYPRYTGTTAAQGADGAAYTCVPS